MTEEVKETALTKFAEKVTTNNLNMSVPEIREFISAVEEELKKFPQVDLPVKHWFSKGVYGREMPIDKGVLLTGKIHKFQSLNIISKGEVSVLSIDGLVRVKAPYTFVGSPGAKRLIFAHEDSVWTTIHGTDLKDVDKIEEEFIAKDYSEIEHEEIKAIEVGEKCLGLP